MRKGKDGSGKMEEEWKNRINSYSFIEEIIATILIYIKEICPKKVPNNGKMTL